ncbi:MAG: flavin reductase family protein [Devosia sp.]
MGAILPIATLADETAAFRTVMRHLVGAVTVVTTGLGDNRTGFTATSVASLSMDPPRLLVCLNRQSASFGTVQGHGVFCVNMLAHDQTHVAERFAGRTGIRGAARYEGAQWHQLITGASALTGSLAAVDCEVEEVIVRHSHSILIGRIRTVEVNAEAEPLLYWQGAYRLLSSVDEVLTTA